MVCNLGSYDRVIRAILGSVIIALGIYFMSWFGLIGVVLLGTSAIKFCPIYWTVKLSTAKKE